MDKYGNFAVTVRPWNHLQAVRECLRIKRSLQIVLCAGLLYFDNKFNKKQWKNVTFYGMI